MKIIIILSTISLILFSCSIKEKPKFLHVENFKVHISNSKYITISTDAFFLNPNDIGGELQTDDIEVFVNNNKIASISTKKFTVPTKNKFSIPLEANIPIDSLFNTKNLGGLINSLFLKKIKVQYKGDIKYKILGFSHNYTINKTETINIKL